MSVVSVARCPKRRYLWACIATGPTFLPPSHTARSVTLLRLPRKGFAFSEFGFLVQLRDTNKDAFNVADLDCALNAEIRADLVNVLKNKLQDLAGKHSDVLENLSPGVRKRMDVLREIQYVFHNGEIDFERLKEFANVVQKQRLVLDLSCRKKKDRYAIVTDKWQKFSNIYLDQKVLDILANYADEFLVHGIDVEGKKFDDYVLQKKNTCIPMQK